ncbi:MAG: alpha/beta hydrolase [Pseudomonadota bacterium]
MPKNMILTKQQQLEQARQLQHLARQLPKLEFILAKDCEWPKSDLPQSYLDYYRINFSVDFANVAHGFGSVNTAGFNIATHYWLPENAQGTLVVVHGYYDHVGVFNHAIRFALERNLAVLAFDLPGHGLSSGNRGEIDSFDQYADVFNELLEQSRGLMPQPLFALGQSTGCAVLLNYLWRYAAPHNAIDRFAKIVLCAPLILARGWRIGRFVYALIHHFKRHVKRGQARSSHDKNFNNFITKEDSLQAKYLSVKWVGAMKAWNQQFCTFAPLQKELLIIQGTGDMTVDWHYNLPTIQRKLPNAKISMVIDAGHQLVNESEDYRSQVFAEVAKYISD